MEPSQDALLPLAILITLIYEGKDEELINVANEVISQKGIYILFTYPQVKKVNEKC